MEMHFLALLPGSWAPGLIHYYQAGSRTVWALSTGETGTLEGSSLESWAEQIERTLTQTRQTEPGSVLVSLLAPGEPLSSARERLTQIAARWSMEIPAWMDQETLSSMVSCRRQALTLAIVSEDHSTLFRCLDCSARSRSALCASCGSQKAVSMRAALKQGGRWTVRCLAQSWAVRADSREHAESLLMRRAL